MGDQWRFSNSALSTFLSISRLWPWLPPFGPRPDSGHIFPPLVAHELFFGRAGSFTFCVASNRYRYLQVGGTQGLFSSRAFPLNPSIRPQRVPTHICGPVAAGWLHMHQNSSEKHKVKQWRAGSLSFRLLARFGCLQWDHSQPTRRALCATGYIKRAVHKQGDSQDSPRPPTLRATRHPIAPRLLLASSSQTLTRTRTTQTIHTLHSPAAISYPMDQFTDIFTMVAA
jgi:hypothetical protein